MWSALCRDTSLTECPQQEEVRRLKECELEPSSGTGGPPPPAARRADEGSLALSLSLSLTHTHTLSHTPTLSLPLTHTLLLCESPSSSPLPEPVLLTTYWSESTVSLRYFSGPASRHRILNSLFQVALHLPSSVSRSLSSSPGSRNTQTPQHVHCIVGILVQI